MRKFPIYRQLEAKDCGATCLRMICKYHGKIVEQEKLRYLSETTRTGTSFKFLATASEVLGFHTLPVKLSLNQLNTIPLPALLHWDQNHFVVLYKISQKKGRDLFVVGDPELGIREYSRQEFLRHWSTKNNVPEQLGLLLLLEKSVDFTAGGSEPENKGLNMGLLLKQWSRNKSFLGNLLFGLLLSSVIQVLFPFLTQAIVDLGIRNQDLNLIYLIILAQIFLFAGKLAIEAVRNWMLLHLSSRLHISLLSSFFTKLTNLPISYFDSKLSGDLLRRYNDHSRVRHFCTYSSLNVVFSICSTVILSFVLLYFSYQIFLIFIICSVAYCAWILLFLKKRRILDQDKFKQESLDKAKLLEIIGGMQDIKLNDLEIMQRCQWEKIQLRLFRINLSALKLSQYQDIGSGFVNELKNLVIIVITATLVVQGNLTLGSMLAIIYLIGQLNAPLTLLTNFIRDYQDSKISLERISEIHNRKNEEEIHNCKSVIEKGDLELDNLSFRYKGRSKYVLKKLNLTIPSNQVTAIVGASGSGKTTLMKLLLLFYDSYEGSIRVNGKLMKSMSPKLWRNQCATIMQDSYIFNESILFNIALTAIDINRDQLDKAVFTANVLEFLEDLPLGINTMIGNENSVLSQGQLQRILIARAVYKNPHYIFLDEATSALDAHNEMIIANRLQTFFKGKTVVIIAHRLSTVINADNIVVLDDGEIVESGTHQLLLEEKSCYYNLIKNQLQMVG